MNSVYDDPTHADVVTDLKIELMRLREFFKVPQDDLRDEVGVLRSLVDRIMRLYDRVYYSIVGKN